MWPFTRGRAPEPTPPGADEIGAMLARLEAFGVGLDRAEDLPVNVVVYVEGEEEIGSPSFTAFLDGEVISLKEVGDGVFSEGIVGEGLAIRPISETLCAPVSGKITIKFYNKYYR